MASNIQMQLEKTKTNTLTYMRNLKKRAFETFQDTLIKASIQQSVGEYLTKTLFICLGISFGIGILLALILKITTTFPSPFLILPLIFSVISLIGLFGYPFLQVDIRQGKINANLPILITYMGGISTSKASRDQLFENVSKRERSFGIAALEVRRIRTLAVEWNFGYLEAIEKVSQTTPSRRFGDFLSRFSQALDAGEKLEDYFRKEQNSQLTGYISDYKRKLKSLEVLNDAFTALSTSLSFIAITFLLMMFLFGSDVEANTINLFLILFVIELVYICLMVVFYVSAPKDQLVSIQRKTSEYEKVLYGFLVCVFIFLPLLLFLTFLVKNQEGENVITLPIFMMVFGLAMAIPGILSEKFENIIKRRDSNFPVFIRTLGGTTNLLGGSIFDSVKLISQEQFGPLTEDIKLLYTQAKFGLSPAVAWQWFSDTTCSSLIDRFLRIFTSSLDIGGSPDIVSNFISVNVEKVLELRQDRHQVIQVFKGTMLPLSAINIGTMIFMRDVLALLYTTMSALTNIQGLSLSLGAPPPDFFIDIFFTIYYLTVPFWSCLALNIPQKGSWMKITKYLSQYYLLTGAELLIVGKLAHTIISGFGVTF